MREQTLIRRREPSQIEWTSTLAHKEILRRRISQAYILPERAMQRSTKKIPEAADPFHGVIRTLFKRDAKKMIFPTRSAGFRANQT